MSALRTAPRSAVCAGCPPPPPAQSPGVAAPPRGGAPPALARAIGLGHHPSSQPHHNHPSALAARASIACFRFPSSIKCPTRLSSFPAFLHFPRPDRPTDRPAGRAARRGAPPNTTTPDPLRTEPCAEPADAGNLAPRRGSKSRAECALYTGQERARQCARASPAPPPDIRNGAGEIWEHTPDARAHAPEIAAAHKRTRG